MIDPSVLDQVVAWLSQQGSGQVLMSRAADPVLRNAVAQGREVCEAPVVRGRTVWSAASGSIVIGELPNWWGRLEEFPASAMVVDHRAEAAASPEALPSPPERWTAHVADARRLAKSLQQIAGLHLAHGAPEAPWFVVLQPQPADVVVGALTAVDGFQATALDRRLAEFPGGIRLTTPHPGGRETVEDCVASLRNAIDEARRS